LNRHAGLDLFAITDREIRNVDESAVGNINFDGRDARSDAQDLALNGEDSIRSMMLGVIRREPSGKVRMFPLLDGDELLQQAQETQTAVRSS